MFQLNSVDEFTDSLTCVFFIQSITIRRVHGNIFCDIGCVDTVHIVPHYITADTGNPFIGFAVYAVAFQFHQMEFQDELSSVS